LLQLLSIAAGGTLAILTIVAAGRLIAPATRLPSCVRFTTGSALVSGLVYLLLTMHVGYWPVFVAMLLLMVLLSRREAALATLPRMPLFFHAIFAISGFFYFTYALAPEIQPDAAGYHLRLVSDYVRLHAFTTRTGFYDALPQGMEMLFVPAFAIGAWPAAKLVHLAFLCATIPLLRTLALEAGVNNFNACAAAAIFFLAPVCGVAGASAYTDAGLVCACCSVAYLLLRWNRERTTSLLVCAAVDAGLCYAIKPTFGCVALCGLIFVAVRSRSPKTAAAFNAAALACIAPWLIRAHMLSGSIASPFLSQWIPNRILTPDVELHLAAQYSAFRPGFSWSHALLGYTLFGGDQGVFGPAFLLIPVAFFALAKPRQRWLVACSALLALPFLFNTGARFLMPAMAFAAIAISAVLPRQAVFALLVIQTVAALARPGDWSLGPLPLAAALRVEPEAHYLRRSIHGFAAGEMIAAKTPRDAKILSCTALPEAYIPRELLTWWHSRRAQQFADALHFAMMSQGTRARLVSWRWRENQYRSLRLTALSDIRVISATLPNADGALNSWREHKPGESISLSTPHGVNGADFLIWPGDQALEKTEVLPSAGNWREPEGDVDRRPCYIDLRRDATAYIRRAGYRYIAIPVVEDPFAEIGVDMVRHPEAWGITIAGESEGIYLLRIRETLF
jgi:hypothetical protein